MTRTWRARLVACLLAALLGSIGLSSVALAVTAAANAATFTYDVQPIARVDSRAIGAVKISPAQLSVAPEASASPQVGSRGTSTTSSEFVNATNTADDFVDLASPARRTHILDGDATGGGHLWPGNPGKTPFPQGWSGGRIMHEISDIAIDPVAWQNAGTQGSRTVLTGTRGGVDIRVIVNTNTGEIITGYPTNLPRNP